jgi:hypothetical protein
MTVKQDSEREGILLTKNGCSEMRETERKERGEILNEDGREIRWMKEIWNRRERMEKKVGIFFLNCFFLCL